MNFILLKNLIKILFLEKLDYIFFSENLTYQNYFIPLISKIDKKKTIVYLSSDKKDFVSQENVRNFYIGSGLIRSFIFLSVRAKFLLLTLTDIDNHDIKKFKNVDYYGYIFHAVNSAHRAFTPNAFDNYDLIFCVGKYHNEEIRKLENFNKSKTKKLINSGYLYFDYLKKNCDLKSCQNAILIAPSWNYSKENFFERNCFNLIKNLLQENLKVILRPHPEHFIRSKTTIDKINDELSGNINFLLDTKFNNIDSMNKSEILITDCSGIAPEFLFLYKRPIIYFDNYKKIHNENFSKINPITFEDNVKKIFGYTFNSNLNEFNVDTIAKVKKEFVEKKDIIENFANENFYNYDDPVNSYLDFFNSFENKPN